MNAGMRPTVEFERTSTLSLAPSAVGEEGEQVVWLFVEEEASRAVRDVCELDASELVPEKKEGVTTFLWNRVKFMEGNPRRVLDFWAGVEGVELEWIMRPTGCRGSERGRAPRPLSSILIYLNSTRNLSVRGHDGGQETTDAFRIILSSRLKRITKFIIIIIIIIK